MLRMMNRFAAAILGAIIMYEIEHHNFMWTFAAANTFLKARKVAIENMESFLL
nr:hypothetical protein [Bacillus cereus group sp. BfR-BA-01316]